MLQEVSSWFGCRSNRGWVRRGAPQNGAHAPASSVSRKFRPSWVLDRERPYDAVVVGAGVSGLVLAATLSRVGNMRVLVLEHGEQAGGGMHTFRGGAARHETGFHYVGHSPSLLQYVGALCNDRVQWNISGDPNTPYDVITDRSEPSSDRAEVRIVATVEGWISSHTAAGFEEKLLRKYMDAIRAVRHPSVELYFKLKALRLPPRAIQSLQNWLCQPYIRMATMTVDQRLDELGITDTRMRGVLCGQYGDYGATPDRASWFVHAGVVNHYLGGTMYPQGGPGSITRELVRSIRVAGGDVLCRATVSDSPLGGERGGATSIRVHYDRARFCDVRANMFCFSNGLDDSSAAWVSDPGLELAPLKVDQPTEFLFLFVEFRLDDPSARPPSFNRWSYPCLSVSHQRQQETARGSVDGLDADMAFFVSSATGKQGSSELQATRGPGTEGKDSPPYSGSVHTAVVLTACAPEWIHPFKDLQRTERERSHIPSQPDYVKWKDAMKEKMLAEAFRPNFPGAKTTYTELGTPLSCKTFLNRRSAYGLPCSPARWTRSNLLPRTRVPGYASVYRTGQDIITPGFAGAVSSAELTANVMLGYVNPVDLILGRDARSDLLALVARDRASPEDAPLAR